MADQNNNIENRYNQFLRLFMEHQGRLLGFILKLLPNYSAAEDILQETALVLWQKFDTYDVNSNYMAWAMQIAKNKVMDYGKKCKVRSIVHFDAEVVEDLAAEDVSNDVDHRYSEALHGCVEKLENKSKQIIRLRYIDRLKVKDIASQLSIQPNTLSKHMSRLHFLLRKCIEEKLSMGGRSHG